MSTFRSCVLLVELTALVTACGGPVPSGPLVVEVGSGQFEFVALAPDAPAEIVCGPQGGQHIWTSMRGRNVDPRSVSLKLGIRTQDGGTQICGQQLRDISLFERGGWNEFAGVACFVRDPDAVRGQPLILSGKITDPSGRSGEASVRIIPFGPAQRCGPGGAVDGGLVALDGGSVDGGSVDGGSVDGGAPIGLDGGG